MENGRKEGGREGMEKLERTGAAQLLIFLYRWSKRRHPERAMLKDVLKAVHAHPETVESAAAFLAELGFINDEKSPVFPFKHVFWLTEAGETLAQHLVAADDVIRKAE